MILLVGVVATLYTVVGGMRAVIWTDVAQFFVLSAGSVLALWVVGVHVGGLEGIWSVAEQGGRTRIFDWTPDLTTRVTSWGALIGSLVANLGMYGADQVSVQRYLAAKSLKGMQKSFILNTVGGWAMGFLMIGIGLGLYAFYALHPGNLPATIGGDKVFPYFHCYRDAAGLAGHDDRRHPGGRHVFDRLGAQLLGHGVDHRFFQALWLADSRRFGFPG